MEKTQLIYFNGIGRAEQIRLLLKEGKVEYEFLPVDAATWAEQKKEFDFGQVPAVKIDGKTLVQSEAIMTYLGKKYGFYPEGADGAYGVMWWYGGLNDVFIPIGGWYGEKDPAKKSEIAKGLMPEHFPKFFAIFEKKLAANSSKDYLVGDKFSIADFGFIGFLKGMYAYDDFKPMIDTILPNHPTLKAYYDKQIKYFYE